MIRTDSERAPILIVIGFVFLAVGALAGVKEMYFLIPMAIGSAVCFVLALFYVILGKIRVDFSQNQWL